MVEGTVEKNLASIEKRLIAKIIDIFAVILVVLWGVIFFRIFGRSLETKIVFIGLFSLAAIVSIVQIIFLTIKGQTLGKMIFGIKIVKEGTEVNGGFISNVLLRYIVNGLLALIPIYIIVDSLLIVDVSRKCLHDRIAGTKVIDIRKRKNLNEIPQEKRYSDNSISYPYQQQIPQFNPSYGMPNNTYTHNVAKKKSNKNIIIISAISSSVMLCLMGLMIVGLATIFKDINTREKNNFSVNSNLRNDQYDDNNSDEDDYYDDETTDFLSFDGSFTLTAPIDWQEAEQETSGKFSLSLQAFDKDRGIFVVRDSKVKLGDISLDNYYSNVAAGYEKEGKNMIQTAPVHKRVNKCAALQYEYDGSINGAEISFVDTIVETKGSFYIITACINKSDYKDYRQELIDIENSLTEHPLRVN
ncbi:MAG: RDD family protein [Bacillota bacterium]|nr:RDD family protein [Bacillota bacterium]